MVAGFYETSEVYTRGTDFYTELSFCVHDHLPCMFHGPATLRLLSNNNNNSLIPIPMSVQVPPGHVVQQVIDENGTLLHVIMPPQASVAVPLPTTFDNHRATSNTNHTGGTSPFIAYPHPPLQPHPAHCQFHAPIHNSHPHLHLISECVHCGMPSHSHQCNTHSSTPGPSSPSSSHLHHKDERSQRQFHKLRKKLESRQKESNSDLSTHPSPTTSPKRDKTDDTKLLEEFLSNVAAPAVTEVSTRSALISWKPLEYSSGKDNGKFTDNINKETITYEILLSDKGKEDTYKSIGKRTNQFELMIENLKPGTYFYVCVRAVLEGTVGKSSMCTTFKTKCCEPDAPHPVKLVTRTKNSLILKWNAPSDNGAKIISYILEYDEGKGNSEFVEIFNGLQKNFKVTKLKVSTCYRFRLSAINEIGKSDYSEISCFSTSGSAPSQPLPPVLKEASVDKLSLEWEKRPFDEEFTLQVEDENTELGFLPVCNIPENSFVCFGLKKNTKYKFRLCANNEDGSSPWSKAVTYCTLPDKPCRPSHLQPKGHINPCSFHLVWDPPLDDGGTPITAYILEIDAGKGFEKKFSGLQTEYTLENLQPGTTYSLRVACQNARGQSEYSELKNVTTAITFPEKCHNFKLHGKAKTHYCQLEWASPNFNGGSPITQYEVQMISPDGSSRQVYIGLDLMCTVAGLLPNTLYMFKVRAYNKAGPGQWTSMLEVLSGAGPPDSPKISLECHSSTTAKISWSEPNNNGAPIIEYYLEFSQDKENFTKINVGLKNYYEVIELSPAKMYFFRIQAINSAGAGSFSEVISCLTSPSVPAAILSSSIEMTCNATTMTLKWQEPNCNGSDILLYNIEIGDLLYATEGNVTEILIEDLLPETTYRVRIQAVNSIGPGPYSSTLKTNTLCLPPPPPKLTCVAAYHNSIRLKWGEGRNVDLIHYILELENKAGSFIPVYQGTNYVYKVSKLQESTLYNFRICAANIAGTGERSKVYSFCTTKSPPPTIKAPRISAITQTSCKVEWQAAKSIGNDSITYQLQIFENQDLEFKTLYQGSETTFNVENLTPNTTYDIRVGAIRHCNDSEEDIPGAFSSSTSFTTLSQDVASRTNFQKDEQSTASLKEKLFFTDQQCAFIILSCFTLFAIIVAVIIEHFLSHSIR